MLNEGRKRAKQKKIYIHRTSFNVFYRRRKKKKNLLSPSFPNRKSSNLVKGHRSKQKFLLFFFLLLTAYLRITGTYEYEFMYLHDEFRWSLIYTKCNSNNPRANRSNVRTTTRAFQTAFRGNIDNYALWRCFGPRQEPRSKTRKRINIDRHPSASMHPTIFISPR